jgi:hypothetical protein
MYRHGEWKYPSDLAPLAEDGVTGLASPGVADAGDIRGAVPRLPGDARTVSPAPATAPQQIVFIEANVPDFQDLIDGLKPGAQAVVRDLDQGRVQQIGAYLVRHDVQRLAGIGGPVEIRGDLAGSTSTWAARAVLRTGTSP